MICPCCGYELSEKRKQVRRLRRHRRLPNGFGSITELKGRRLHKPFFVRVSVGKDELGRPILRSLKPQAYFATYNDAYSALLSYNQNPYDLSKDITVKELFDQWIEYIEENSKPQTAKNYRYTFNYCHDMYGVKVREIRAHHIKYCMDNAVIIPKKGPGKGEPRKASAGTKDKIKQLWNNMLDYALEYELVDKNYSRTFGLSPKIQKEIIKKKRAHLPFSAEEMDKLWSLTYDNTEEVSKLILIQCFTGLRPNELCNLELDNAEKNMLFLKGGSKTAAGRDRIIPIHSAIRPLVQSYYDQALAVGSKWLINTTDSRSNKNKPIKLTYRKYAYDFKNLISKYADVMVNVGASHVAKYEEYKKYNKNKKGKK